MRISIIIPSYNRSHLIGLTLDSFVKQNFDKNEFEIIVADNNSTDSTRQVIDKFIKSNPEVKITYFLESRQGVHFARNSAAKLAKGEYLYFTDDDMIADSNLLSELLYLFGLDNKIASVTGLVLPKWEIDPPRWILKLCMNGYLSLNNPPYDLIVSENDCNVFSCHQMIRREVFFKSGGFNPENTMGQWIGDGETGLNLKIKELNYKFAFNRKSVIYHIIPPARLTQSYLNKRLQNQGYSDCYTYYHQNHPSFGGLLLQCFRIKVKLFYHILKFIANLLRLNSGWRLDVANWYYCIATLKYNIKLMHNSEWRFLVSKDNWLSD